MKIIKDRNILENQRDSREAARTIEGESDWNDPVTQTFEMRLPQKHINKPKMGLVNNCLTEEREVRPKDRKREEGTVAGGKMELEEERYESRKGKDAKEKARIQEIKETETEQQKVLEEEEESKEDKEKPEERSLSELEDGKA